MGLGACMGTGQYTAKCPWLITPQKTNRVKHARAQALGLYAHYRILDN